MSGTASEEWRGWVELGGWMTGMWLPIVAGGATVLRELPEQPVRHAAVRAGARGTRQTHRSG